ncbi:hypothetical protein WN48_02800 [Eufriesea mexicana]|uniref:Uncharacterized protein n=1 Tax=Eufriesea mexicana TaxID=516756 RepID=A0A310SFC8_9HYME|nr:hypothetical protein WN48_02800 [Eufriesea mexicana]
MITHGHKNKHASGGETAWTQKNDSRSQVFEERKKPAGTELLIPVPLEFIPVFGVT